MLSVNLHDRVGDSLDLLSMLSNCLVAMMGGYAMRVDRPREILEQQTNLQKACRDIIEYMQPK